MSKPAEPRLARQIRGLSQILLSNQRANYYIRTHPRTRAASRRPAAAGRTAPLVVVWVVWGRLASSSPPSPHARLSVDTLCCCWSKPEPSPPQEPRVLRARIPSRSNRTDAFDCHLGEKVGRLESTGLPESECVQRRRKWGRRPMAGSGGRRRVREERRGAATTTHKGVAKVLNRGDNRGGRAASSSVAPPDPASRDCLSFTRPRLPPFQPQQQVGSRRPPQVEMREGTGQQGQGQDRGFDTLLARISHSPPVRACQSHTIQQGPVGLLNRPWALWGWVGRRARAPAAFGVPRSPYQAHDCCCRSPPQQR